MQFCYVEGLLNQKLQNRTIRNASHCRWQWWSLHRTL